VPLPIALRLDADWIVPVEPAGALAGHAVLVDGGRIVAIVPAAQATRDYAPRDHVSLPHHILIPGLVNAHTHAAMTLLRGIADDVPLQAWLSDHIWPREARFVSPEFVHDGTLLAAAEMLKGGITCCNDQYFYPDASARAYAAAGMRAMLGLPVLDFPTPYAADADGYLQAGLAARDAHRHVPGLAFSLAPHAPYTVGDGTFARIVTLARELDLLVQTHLQETAQELADALRATGMTPLARLDRLGVTGPSFVAHHAVHPGGGDAELLAAQRCHVVHCPTSNLKLASGIAPIADYLARGINVALGTDGAASNNRLDIFGEMRLAALIAKVATGDAAALPAASVLRMATLNGAQALGFDADIGSLRPGKAADIVAVSSSGAAFAPCYDPVSHLVHVAGRDQVTDVWVNGERRVAAGRLATLDEDAIVARAGAWRERLQ
jgi:5-methylthioadenosine/S-adenosylhomocysteine deaminase